MKTHFCPAEKTTIAYRGKCNWCGEQEALAQTQEPSGHFLDFAYSDSIAQVHVYDQFQKGQQFYTHPPQRTEQEPPKYSFKAHWEKDGRIGVVAVVERPDGGFHVLEDIIDAPKEKNT